MMRYTKTPYRCRVSTHRGTDTFVGLCSDGKEIEICFPLGFRLSDTQEGQKQDIRLLIRVLSRFSQTEDRPPRPGGKTIAGCPIHAYLTVLDEFYNRGYYTELERICKTGGRGPKNWSRTVATQTPYPQNGSLLFLTPVTRESRVNTESYLTKISEFCVEEAYQKIGFLFPDCTPRRSTLPFDEKRFLSVLHDRLRRENNDRNKNLLSGMIDMIQYLGRNGKAAGFFYGTDRFEFVWQQLIDFDFGTERKQDYYPRAFWKLTSGSIRPTYPLIPDTITRDAGDIFVLDGKYYRYGDSGLPEDLPGSNSISKQITYGEYIAVSPKFQDAAGLPPTVYNAFLLPFDQESGLFPSAGPMYLAGEAQSNWKRSGALYERIYGVLLDSKWLMSRTVRQNPADIRRLADLIRNA